MKIVLMGVAGCGKSSVGVALSAATGLPYRDGDDLHPAENIAKMSRGEALVDADRWPWLRLIGQALRGPGIVGCSALKRVYRELIDAEAGGGVVFVHLSGARAVIEARMADRRGHFMPASLLDSQLQTLERPGVAEPDVLHVDIDQPLNAVVQQVCTALQTPASAMVKSPLEPRA